jgi:hypothetical protein
LRLGRFIGITPAIVGKYSSHSTYRPVRKTRASSDDPDPFLCLDASGAWKPVPFNTLPICAAIAILFVSAAPLLARSGYWKWAMASLKGHLTLWPLMFGIPEILLGLHLNFIEGTLTANWAAHVVIYGAIISTVTAVPFWFFFTKPFIVRRRKRQQGA